MLLAIAINISTGTITIQFIIDPFSIIDSSNSICKHPYTMSFAIIQLAHHIQHHDHMYKRLSRNVNRNGSPLHNQTQHVSYKAFGTDVGAFSADVLIDLAREHLVDISECFKPAQKKKQLRCSRIC